MMDAEQQPNSSQAVEQLHAVIKSLFDFDRAHLRLPDTFMSTPRENCIALTYCRAQCNIVSLIRLRERVHFQAISMVTRALLELAVDMRLIDIVPDGAEKMMAFAEVEQFRSMQKIVRSAQTHPGMRFDDVERYAVGVAEQEAGIEAREHALWPGRRRVTHWSGWSMRQRVDAIGGRFVDIYDVDYQRLSWYAHSGLSAVATLDWNVLEAMCGLAFGISSECYGDMLQLMIIELRLAESDDKIVDRYDFARFAPLLNTAQEVADLRRELLGE